MLITATLPAALAVSVVGISGSDDGPIGIRLASRRAVVACPGCSTPTQRLHSR